MSRGLNTWEVDLHLKTVKEFNSDPYKVLLCSLLRTEESIIGGWHGTKNASLEKVSKSRIAYAIRLDLDLGVHCGDCTMLPASCSLCAAIRAIEVCQDIIRVADTVTDLRGTAQIKFIISKIFATQPPIPSVSFLEFKDGFMRGTINLPEWTEDHKERLEYLSSDGTQFDSLIDELAVFTGECASMSFDELTDLMRRYD